MDVELVTNSSCESVLYFGEPHRKKSIPLAHNLLTIVSAFRERSAYRADSDWVFASPYKHGAEPYWPDSALTKFVKPAVKRAGITKTVGWHTFRHSYRSWLDETGAPLTVQKELMRHASIQTTMNIYGKAMTDTKRQAHTKVVELVLRKSVKSEENVGQTKPKAVIGS